MLMIPLLLVFEISFGIWFQLKKYLIHLSVHARVGPVLPGGEGQGHQARRRRTLRRDPCSGCSSKFL